MCAFKQNDMTRFVFCLSFLLGYNFLRPLEDDLIYSDSDDDDEDDNDHSRHAAKQPLQPHPQIKQLTEEVVQWFHLCRTETVVATYNMT